MAAHRYWRIQLRAINGPNGGLGELQMRESIGGVNVATGGTPSASSVYGGTQFPASKAFDGLTEDTGVGNGWAAQGFSGGAGIGSFPWLKYDFGAGNEKDIAEIVIYCPGTGGLGVNEMPIVFDWQWSDDDIEWITQRSVAIDSMNSPWGYNTMKIFDVRPLGPIDINNSIAMQMLGGQFREVVGRPGDLTYDPNTTAGKALIGIGHFSHDPVHGGSYKLSGTTTSLGNTVSRRVRLYSQIGGRLQAEQITNDDGSFEFSGIDIGPWTVVGIDDTGTQNGVIYSHVNAVPM